MRLNNDGLILTKKINSKSFTLLHRQILSGVSGMLVSYLFAPLASALTSLHWQWQSQPLLLPWRPTLSYDIKWNLSAYLFCWNELHERFRDLPLCSFVSCPCELSRIWFFVTPWSVGSSVHGISQVRILEWVAHFHLHWYPLAYQIDVKITLNQ